MRIAEVFVMAIVALLVILLVARPIINHVLKSAQEKREQERAAAEQAAAQAQLLPGAAGMPGALGGPAPGMEGPSEIEQMIDIAQVEGRVRASSIKKIGEIVEKHPEEAVAILRTWMYQET